MPGGLRGGGAAAPGATGQTCAQPRSGTHALPPAHARAPSRARACSVHRAQVSARAGSRPARLAGASAARAVSGGPSERRAPSRPRDRRPRPAFVRLSFRQSLRLAGAARGGEWTTGKGGGSGSYFGGRGPGEGGACGRTLRGGAWRGAGPGAGCGGRAPGEGAEPGRQAGPTGATAWLGAEPEEGAAHRGCGLLPGGEAFGGLSLGERLVPAAAGQLKPGAWDSSRALGKVREQGARFLSWPPACLWS